MVSLTMNMKLMNEYNGVTCVIKVVVRAGTPHAEIAAYIISVKSLVVRSLEQSGFVRACANTPRRSVSRALNRHPSIRLFRPDLQIYDNGGGRDKVMAAKRRIERNEKVWRKSIEHDRFSILLRREQSPPLRNL